jgi:hypothetical protein
VIIAAAGEQGQQLAGDWTLLIAAPSAWQSVAGLVLHSSTSRKLIPLTAGFVTLALHRSELTVGQEGLVAGLVPNLESPERARPDGSKLDRLE